MGFFRCESSGIAITVTVQASRVVTLFRKLGKADRNRHVVSASGNHVSLADAYQLTSCLHWLLRRVPGGPRRTQPARTCLRLGELTPCPKGCCGRSYPCRK